MRPVERRPEPRSSGTSGLAPWVAGFALGALAIVLLRPARTTPPPEPAKKEEPTPAPRPEVLYRAPAAATASEPAKRPAAPGARDERPRDEKARTEADRSAMRAAVRAALDRIRPESYFEQKAGLLFNTVSDCRVVDEVWPTPERPSFRVVYSCKVVNEQLQAQERSFEIRGSVEKQGDQWQANF